VAAWVGKVPDGLDGGGPCGRRAGWWVAARAGWALVDGAPGAAGWAAPGVVCQLQWPESSAEALPMVPPQAMQESRPLT